LISSALTDLDLERLQHARQTREHTWLSTVSCPITPTARFLSVSRVHNLASKDPVSSEKPWAKTLLRYHNDAAFREKRIARAKAWRLNNLDKYRQITRTLSKVYYPDPAYCQKKSAWGSKLYREQYSKDPVFMQRMRLRSWVYKHPGVMSVLPWKTHSPQWYPTSFEHACHSCRVTRHNGGSRLWWQRLGSDDQYDCHPCYVKDVDASMPEGYEGITRWRDMIARKEELDRLGQSN
jgi:hypothetical protein